MFTRVLTVLVAASALTASIGALSPASAASRDQVFFDSVAGTWSGSGEIVAGKYKGTKFSCDLKGTPNDDADAGIKLDGSCRVGLFSQPMSAVIGKNGGTYKGQFLDGAAGKGLDITSGTVNADGDKVTMGLLRSKLNGAMVAHLNDDDAMNVTISVKVEDQLVPVIGLSLTRQKQVVVGSLK